MFLRLGLTAFGGPVAHIAMMEDEAVVRRQWLMRERFLDLLGVPNLLHGPRCGPLADGGVSGDGRRWGRGAPAEPTASVLIVNIAWPEPFRVPVPRIPGPSLKVTVPVGVPAPGLFAVTVAVKVTDCPDTDGLAEELTDVAVLAFFTVWVSALEVLPVKVASPP